MAAILPWLMQVFCPRCGASSEVGAAVKNARCSACGEALPVHLPAFGPPQGNHVPHAFGVEDMAAVPRVVPPKTKFVWVERQQMDGVWVASIQGPGGGCAAMVFLACTVAASYGWGTAESLPVAAMVLGVLAAFFGYKALAGAVNRTIVRVAVDWFTVRRGPLPERLGARLATAAVLRFQVARAGTPKSDAFRIVAVTGDGVSRRLPIGPLRRGEAGYVCERLARMLADAQKRGGGPPLQPLVGPPQTLLRGIGGAPSNF